MVRLQQRQNLGAFVLAVPAAPDELGEEPTGRLSHLVVTGLENLVLLFGIVAGEMLLPLADTACLVLGEELMPGQLVVVGYEDPEDFELQ